MTYSLPKMVSVTHPSDEPKIAPSPRYMRRSSVTRYSLEHMSIPNGEKARESMDVSSKSGAKSPVTVVNQRRRPSRRSSVTRYSLQSSSIPETRSLSPVPFSRRGSTTKVTVEQVIGEEEEQPVLEAPVPTKHERYRRRCSVTKYSLECAEQVSVKVTIEEPCDTVDSIEHRKMLANDTIESMGAGDLIVGWDQATADFIEEHLYDHDDRDLICGFGTKMTSSPAFESKSEGVPIGGYIMGVLKRTFTDNSWIKTLNLNSEVNFESSPIKPRPFAISYA